ncbi:MAG: sulfotransferase domain-containing protein [Xenococcaceae cyanobacterium MO_188.B32]|nr:sulfotransferase domain-containing protein [Xenococcaceae cyanobacterium MO_188.B32]
MKEPNFIIIGAPKSGTTSLYHYLNQHPQVFMSPKKEPKFFAFEEYSLDFNGPNKGVEQIKQSTVTTYSKYLKLFETADKYKAIGEASPIYLHNPTAPKKISQYLPKVKLIAILRNPIERLYSDWKHQVRMGWEPEKNFLQALKKWEKREKENWLPYLNYFPKGLYYENLSRYFNLFEAEQIKVVLYEDLKSDANKLMRDLFHFLEIDENVTIDTSKHYMKSRPIPKNSIVESFLKLLEKITKKGENAIPLESLSSFRKSLSQLNKISEKVSPSVRRYLIKIYQDDILELQDLIDRDLSCWLV